MLTLILKDDVLSKKMSDKIKSLAKPDASLEYYKKYKYDFEWRLKIFKKYIYWGLEV